VTPTEQCNISNCAQASFILLSHRISHTYLSCYVSSPCHQGLDKLMPYRHHCSLSVFFSSTSRIIVPGPVQPLIFINLIQVKLPLCIIWRHVGSEFVPTLIPNSTINENKFLASCSGCITSENRVWSSPWIRQFINPSLSCCFGEERICFLWESNHDSSESKG